MQRPTIGRSTANDATTAIYARYSSHNQDDGTSIDVQLDYCRRAAGVPSREYIDRGVTGTTMTREAFGQLLEDCEAGRIKTVYVYKWDRFGRSARAHTVLADLEELGVKVISATEGFEPLSRGIQLVVAEDFSRKLSERVRASKKRRFEEGAWHGGTPPFGYRVVSDGKLKHLAPDWDGEAEIVRWLFKTYLSDSVGFKHLASKLNERGIKTRRAPYWTSGTVRMMLANSLYAGRAVRLGSLCAQKRHYARKFQDDANRTVRSVEAFRIIDDKTFDRVQAKQRTRKSLRPLGSNHTRKFSRMLTCGCCGNTMIRCGRGAAHRTGHYWTCGLRMRIKKDLCKNSTYFSEDSMLAFIQNGFGAVFEDVEGIVKAAISEAEKLTRSNRKRALELDKRLAEVDHDLDRLTQLLLDADLTDVAVKRLLSRQVAEKSAQRDKITAARASLGDDDNQQSERIAAAVRLVFSQAKESLAAVTTESEFNQFIRDYIGPMVCLPDGTLQPNNETSPSASEYLAEAIQYRLLDRKF